MKFKKKVKEFYYSRDIQNILNELDEIGLSRQSKYIDKICNRYPFLSKIEVAMIIKTTFETMREILIRGGIININSFFFDFKLHFFEHKRSKQRGVALKSKIKTPPIFKGRKSFKPYEKINERRRKARKNSGS